MFFFFFPKTLSVEGELMERNISALNILVSAQDEEFSFILLILVEVLKPLFVASSGFCFVVKLPLL